MAVGFAAGGNPSAGTTAVNPVTPTPIDPDGMLFAIHQGKYPATPPDVPAGYALGAQASGGAGAAGVDSGDVLTTVFARLSDGTEDGAIVAITIPGGNSSVGKVVYFTKSAGMLWDIEYATGSDVAAGTDWSITFGAANFQPGDLVMVISTVNGNSYTYSGTALTAAGITFINQTELATNSIAAGDDLAWMVSLHEVGLGSATVAATVTMTASGTAGNEPAGSAVLIRLREVGSGIGIAAGFGGPSGRMGRMARINRFF